MRTGHIFALLAVLIFATLLAWRSRLGSQIDPLTYYAPDKFVEKANDFIAKGLLDVDCRNREPRLVVDLEAASREERAWYEESYLKSDVQAFNRDPAGFGWAFAIDNDCRLRGVHPAVHTIELPFHRRLLWLGDILYRGKEADATLRSARRTIRLDQPQETPRTSRTGVGKSENVLQASSLLFHFPGGPGQPAGRVSYLGQEVVVQNRVRSGRPESTHLLGHRLPVGRWARLESGDWLTFESEDRFTRSSETFVYLGGESKRVASTVQRQNDRFDRRTDDVGLGQVPDPSRDRAFPYLTQVAKTMDRVISLFPEEEGENLATAFDLQLTIDRELQVTVSETLREGAERLRRSRGLDLPFSAGITVMDGLSGDLLALATYPNDHDLRGIDLSSRAKRRALQNQNLIVHPIGSALKPYLFAAAAQANPELLTFEVAGHAPTRYHPDLFHCRIPLGYQLLPGHHQEWIDFRTALEISCNRYTIELMTLALATRASGPPASNAIPFEPGISWPAPGRPSGARFRGIEITGPPELGTFFSIGNKAEASSELGSVVHCGTLDRLDEASWRLPLEEITGAYTYRGLDPSPKTNLDPTRRELEMGYLSNRYDLAPWMPLVRRLTAAEAPPISQTEDLAASRSLQVRTTLQEIAPERVNLALNQVTRLRGDYISLMLGGGTSVWTNIQLAEALARLVTGRAIRARLVDSLPSREPAASEEPKNPTGEDPETQDLPPALDLRSEVRVAVLEGMARVVEGAQGTAKPLQDELASLRAAHQESTIAIYSKTGSPILEKSVPAAAGEALERLVVRGRLVWNGRSLRLEPSTGQALDHVPAGKPGREAYLATLAQSLAEVGYRRSNWIRSISRRVIDEYAADLAATRDRDEIEGPFQISDGRLRIDREDVLFRSQRVKSKGGIYHFALVKLPGKNRQLPPSVEDLSDPKAQILVVAIHLEAGEGSEDAVVLAESLLLIISPILN